MKELKLEDYDKIKKYLDLANYEGYNSNFVTMMMWNHEYHIQYEIHDHFMVMLHHYKDIYFWAMPFTSEEYYQEAIDYMIDYSEKNHFDFMIDCAIEEFVNKVKKIYGQNLVYERTPYNDDYIYDRKMLQTLSGKKMQKRRNHYNAFLKNYPQYIYRDLDINKDFDTILNCLNKWETDKDNMSESMTSEIYGIMYLLSSKHLLNFEVGGIFIDGVMEAFIIASRLKHQTIQIHVEKANKNIRGLYPAILKEMLEHHFPDELYINREEDMGLENLRKSKQSLHPIKMIYKYRITKNKTNIAKANNEDKNEIIHLWQMCFQDENEDSTQYYFDNLYTEDCTYVLKQENKIISVVQIVPMNISIQNNKEEVYFILGVCTHPNYQNQGFMTLLLNYVLKLYYGKKIYLQAYHPEIYRPFGFFASHYHHQIELDTSTLIKDDSLILNNKQDLLKGYYEVFVKQYDEYRIRDDVYWNLLIKRCAAFHDHIVIFQNYGYMIYHQDNHDIYVSEIIYINQESLYHMLNYFYMYDGRVIIECDLKANIPGQRKKLITMMVNHDTRDNVDPQKYINEIY